MAPPTIPTVPPVSLVAGDSATWDDAAFAHPLYGNFTSTLWTLSYAFVGQTATVVDATVVVNGSGWRTTLTAAQTTALKQADVTGPDTVGWSAFVTSGSDRYTVASGTLRLFANPATQSGGVASANVTMLAALDAAILDLVTSGVSAFQIQGRGVTKQSLPDLRKMRAQYAYLVWQERNPGQMGVPVLSRFTGSA